MTYCNQVIVSEGQAFGCQREATIVKREWCNYGGNLGVGTHYRYTCDEHADSAPAERSRDPITDKKEN